MGFLPVLLSCDGLGAIECDAVYFFSIDNALQGVAIEGNVVGFFGLVGEDIGLLLTGRQTKNEGPLGESPRSSSGSISRLQADLRPQRGEFRHFPLGVLLQDLSVVQRVCEIQIPEFAERKLRLERDGYSH